LNEGNAEKLAASTQANTMLSRSFSINDTLLQPENKTVKPALAPTIFSGQVVDENNKAIPGVLVQSPGKKDAVVTDLNGDFNLLAKDTTLRVTASTVGYLEQVTNLTSGYNSPIVLRARPTNLNEVVRVGYDAAKKQAVNIDSFIQAKSLAKDSTMPVGGWQNFNHYVMTQLDKDTVSTPEVYGNDLVELEFLVDNTGSPYNIKITKPLDKTRNAKAIEILKNGPRWISTSHRKKNKVTISF
jgi:hypothetical protein